jgi:hypothetical protein
LTNGSDTRIYQQLNAGERRQYKIGIVVDRSASVMGTVALQGNAVCATVMALARMGLDTSTAVVSFGGYNSPGGPVVTCLLPRVAFMRGVAAASHRVPIRGKLPRNTFSLLSPPTFLVLLRASSSLPLSSTPLPCGYPRRNGGAGEAPSGKVV